MKKGGYVWAIIGVLVIGVIVEFAIYRGMPDWQGRGQFGDMFGATNALFSGLALAGVIFALAM